MMFYLSLVAFVFFFSAQSYRPHIFTGIMTVLAFMGFLNGLTTCRLLKFFGLTDWVFSAIVSSITLPAFIYICLGTETILYAMAGGYARNSLLMSLLKTVIWCTCNALSCFFGSFKGYTYSRLAKPAPTSNLPRDLPP